MLYLLQLVLYMMFIILTFFVCCDTMVQGHIDHLYFELDGFFPVRCIQSRTDFRSPIFHRHPFDSSMQAQFSGLVSFLSEFSIAYLLESFSLGGCADTMVTPPISSPNTYEIAV